MVRVNVIEVKPAAVCLNNATVGVTLKNSNVLKGEAAARAAADDAGRLPQRRHSRRLASTRGLRRPAPQPPGAVNGVPHGAPCTNPLPPVVNSGGSPPAPVPRTPAPAPPAKQLAPRPTWQVGAPSPPHRPPSSASPSPAPSASPLPSPSPSPSLSVTMSPSPSLSLATPSPSLASSSSAPQPCGWVRVFVGGEAEGEASAAAAGPGAGPGAAEERGTLVYLTATSTVRDVCRDLLLSDDLTLWVQKYILRNI
ncbi:Protein of unknown function [Gryllus bimaculatus]|nr:Protein of unknown function [Gryllus bimaculatus]